MFKKYGSIEDIRFKKEINHFLNNNPYIAQLLLEKL